MRATPADLHDPWTMLRAGDSDPLYFGYGGSCRKYDRTGRYVCTRKPAHEGYCVAAYSPGYVCCDAWGTIPLELQLPEGF